jgi:spore coat protein A
VQVLSRQPFEMEGGRIRFTGPARGPERNELGWKETVQMHPGEVTSVAIRFNLPAGLPFAVPTTPRAAEMGLTNPVKTYHEYVWHCHILEHEEHDMMRPLVVES